MVGSRVGRSFSPVAGAYEQARATVCNNLPQTDVWNHATPSTGLWVPIAPPDYPEPSASTEIGSIQRMDDWWRVAMMVAVVIVGAALVLYVGMEWAAGM